MRCSVTDLDAFRNYRDDEDADLETLLRRLRKQEPPSRAMMAGRALHSYLEHASPGADVEVIECDGFRFRFALDCDFVLPRVRELKGEWPLATSAGPVMLVGVTDGIELGLHDYKLTSRFDAERYADSYQWRCYLAMFGGKRFRYDVFVAREDERAGEFVIYEYHPLTFYAYAAMEDEVRREVDAFATFAVVHLPERFEQQEAA